MKKITTAHPPPKHDTPLDHWSTDVDPAIMAGQHWVDEGEDVGNASDENRDYEEGIIAQSGIFMHPYHDVSYGRD
ncbi:DUF3905 domain-containing protein [Microaerobacter geothermalis]|uniref:DUF3905 domain-containing protein n=1 Tax=Microaerobacter geothermalis TaxID=674972 RepID=UPI001F290D55|nr:DUF3905 domain-containing protein [Microaerobacter geothermalis]MCF6093854.1 DUF3905 domain-containing protein [Microaerobacter geothermalis]